MEFSRSSVRALARARNSHSHWQPAQQGLGHRVTQRAHAFEALGILMPRTEDREDKDRKDDIYKFGHHK